MTSTSTVHDIGFAFEAVALLGQLMALVYPSQQEFRRTGLSPRTVEIPLL